MLWTYGTVNPIYLHLVIKLGSPGDCSIRIYKQIVYQINVDITIHQH